MLTKAAIVYCSPAGSTRHVAQVIGKELEQAGMTVLSADLSKGDDGSSVISAVRNEKIRLFIGSPVYVSRSVPPVMKFISQLPENADCCAVPFITWGGACSGIALYDMGMALTDKRIPLVGAAKVLAIHSILRQFENPLGEGHPNEVDDRLIRELVRRVLKKTSDGFSETISLSTLAYQSEKAHAEMEKMSLETAKGHMPKKELIEDKCSQCKICEENCPVQSIKLSPYPEFGANCICCYQCVRVCPEEAIQADLTVLEERIRGRAKQFAEHPPTQIFV
jgi:NAD-dependent dihydropyrimidine dehydrogenase PreA subunit/flavodoxin